MKSNKVYRSKNITYGVTGLIIAVLIFFLFSYLISEWIDFGFFLFMGTILDIYFGIFSLISIISGFVYEDDVNRCLRERFCTANNVDISPKSPVLWGDGDTLIIDEIRYSPRAGIINLGSTFRITQYYSSQNSSVVTLVSESVFGSDYLTCFKK